MRIFTYREKVKSKTLKHWKGELEAGPSRINVTVKLQMLLL
jgi:hypothetical protein